MGPMENGSTLEVKSLRGDLDEGLSWGLAVSHWLERSKGHEVNFSLCHHHHSFDEVSFEQGKELKFDRESGFDFVLVYIEPGVGDAFRVWVRCYYPRGNKRTRYPHWDDEFTFYHQSTITEAISFASGICHGYEERHRSGKNVPEIMVGLSSCIPPMSALVYQAGLKWIEQSYKQLVESGRIVLETAKV